MHFCLTLVLTYIVTWWTLQQGRGTDPDLERLAEEQGSRCRTQRCCHSPSSPGQNHAGTQEKWMKEKSHPCAATEEDIWAESSFLSLILPVRLPVCSRDTEGFWGRIWVHVPQEASLPALPRVSSCGGPTPGPRCPAEGCNAGAGALGSQKRRRMTQQHMFTTSTCWLMSIIQPQTNFIAFIDELHQTPLGNVFF